jgi:hypothetical protein
VALVKGSVGLLVIMRTFFRYSTSIVHALHLTPDAFQCAIPAFEDLLPEPHHDIVQKLLYLCAQWHALAKLRLHNDLTLRKLENITVLMTDQFRIFVHETCSKIVTYELKNEQDARNRRSSRTKSKGKKPAKPQSVDNRTSDRQRRHFNIDTYKFHALGDYVDNIRLFGTTDSYSTELVSHPLSCI